MQRILNYPGSKWQLADWIVGLMPPHKSYLEPFFGSGAVFFAKDRAPIETINDVDGEVVNLFRVLRDEPEALAASLWLTPYSRAEYDGAWAQLHAADQVAMSPVERARLTLTRYWQAQGSTAARKAGWRHDVAGREAAYALRNWAALPDRIWDVANRLREAQIEQQPATELIPRFASPEVLIYADPPYLRSKRWDWQYRHELDDAGHEALLQTLLRHPGPVMLSGYDNELYNDMLRGWEQLRHTAQAQGGAVRTEVLWINFEIQLRLDM